MVLLLRIQARAQALAVHHDLAYLGGLPGLSQPDLCYNDCGRLPTHRVIYRDRDVDYSAVGPAEQLLCEGCLVWQLVAQGATGCNIEVRPHNGCFHEWRREVLTRAGWEGAVADVCHECGSFRYPASAA